MWVCVLLHAFLFVLRVCLSERLWVFCVCVYLCVCVGVRACVIEAVDESASEKRSQHTPGTQSPHAAAPTRRCIVTRKNRAACAVL